ncbi:hypothetical protein NEIG_01572 [Nematocida sp. ERTm5]|nr:hypothetical protein NEIG_01572 [Nematocida sp. ERTm5]
MIAENKKSLLIVAIGGMLIGSFIFALKQIHNNKLSEKINTTQTKNGTPANETPVGSIVNKNATTQTKNGTPATETPVDSTVSVTQTENGTPATETPVGPAVDKNDMTQTENGTPATGNAIPLGPPSVSVTQTANSTPTTETPVGSTVSVTQTENSTPTTETPVDPAVPVIQTEQSTSAIGHAIPIGPPAMPVVQAANSTTTTETPVGPTKPLAVIQKDENQYKINTEHITQISQMVYQMIKKSTIKIYQIALKSLRMLINTYINRNKNILINNKNAKGINNDGHLKFHIIEKVEGTEESMENNNSVDMQKKIISITVYKPTDGPNKNLMIVSEDPTEELAAANPENKEYSVIITETTDETEEETVGAVELSLDTPTDKPEETSEEVVIVKSNETPEVKSDDNSTILDGIPIFKLKKILEARSDANLTISDELPAISDEIPEVKSNETPEK